jgi:hypothetical protein
MQMVSALKVKIAGCHFLPLDFLSARIELFMAAHKYSTHYRQIELWAGRKFFNFALAFPWVLFFLTLFQPLGWVFLIRRDFSATQKSSNGPTTASNNSEILATPIYPP